jgi:hypothetical protein
MYEAIMAEEQEVFIQSFLFWVKLLTSLLPLYVKDNLQQFMVGAGMDSFTGKDKQT